MLYEVITQTLAQRAKLFSITAFMHLQQPMARLIGRIRHGLTPWRRRGVGFWRLPAPTKLSIWREQWEAPDQTLEELCGRLSESGVIVTAGGDYDGWDLEARGGLLGGARVLMATEEHGAGKQLLRFSVWPRWSIRITSYNVCYTKLLRRGAEVFVPTLTGLGEREHLATPEVGLETHIQDVLGTLHYEDLEDVVLVGHSYGA